MFACSGITLDPLDCPAAMLRKFENGYLLCKLINLQLARASSKQILMQRKTYAMGLALPHMCTDLDMCTAV